MVTSKAPALRLAAVSKSYGKVRALDGLSVDVPEGCFFVLFGPSSVGKTTALRAISGLVIPDSGRIEMFGTDMTRAPIPARGVSMVFQSFALYPHLTVFENFAYPLREARVSSAEIATRVKETAAMLRLSHRLERKPSTLSGGEQQRVALGRSLIRRPKNTPVVSPRATSSTTTPMLTITRAVGDSTFCASSGANRTPMIAPPSTPTNDSSATAMPWRQPDTPASTASSSTKTSTQLMP